MESTPKKAPRSKFPALLVVALALVALVFVIWRVDSAPSTNDAYASAEVDSIGYGVLPDDGGLVLGGLPKVSRSINWVRVAQRFPVKIMVDKPDPEMFRIGASAVANLEPQ
ncbi:hypothetical protein ELP71_10310 [Shigella sonnei]|nr:hypothetical protein [Shigella sonnei]RUK71833.1 hypothetical protein ELP71_10310 [Shigella sonnei]RUK84761.1 hypothetical protein ELP79_17225 [Shigella sonnei]